MNGLKVKAGPPAPGDCVYVKFYRRGTGRFPCLIYVPAARDDNYLRSLVEFMQHRVPGK